MPVRETFPAHLGKLVYDTTSGRYEVAENGVTYFLTLEQAKTVTDRFTSLAEWYDTLDEGTKEQVWRTSGPH